MHTKHITAHEVLPEKTISLTKLLSDNVTFAELNMQHLIMSSDLLSQYTFGFLQMKLQGLL